jgi:hypothetical protein
MSYAIENLKFTIFGHGYDATRNDSGSGVENVDLPIKADMAVIDESGAYMWFRHPTEGLKKFSTRTWEEVEQSTIPTNMGSIHHPSNVSNNYGVAITSDTFDAYVFDLTDDTLVGIYTGLNSTLGGTYDCILVDNTIYIIWLNLGNTWLDVHAIDLSGSSVVTTRTIGGVGSCGFVTDSLIYSCYTREWGYQTSTAYCTDRSGNVLWSNTGVNRNDNIGQWAIPSNGYLYMPVLIDDTWHYGVFDGTSNPTFNPVTPIRTFGSFENAPFPDRGGNNRRYDLKFNHGRTRACLWTQIGLLYTDFHKVETITEENEVPLAMNDRFIITRDFDTYDVHVYGY